MRWRMSVSDSTQAAIATTTGIAVYGFTLQEIVVVLWAIYVMILILIRLPDMLKKYPFIGAGFRRVYRWIFGRRQ